MHALTAFAPCSSRRSARGLRATGLWPKARRFRAREKADPSARARWHSVKAGQSHDRRLRDTASGESAEWSDVDAVVRQFGPHCLDHEIHKRVRRIQVELAVG